MLPAAGEGCRFRPASNPGAGRQGGEGSGGAAYASGIEMIHNEFVKGDNGKEIKADCVFEGTEGIILVSRGGISSLPDTILKQPITEKDEKVYASTDHKANWLDCIKSGKDTICTAEIGHRSASICHLGNIGYRLGR